VTDTTAEGKLRIVVFLPSLAGGGAERAMVGVATALAERRHTVALRTASDAGPGSLWPDPALGHRSFGTRHARTAIPALVRDLRAERPDVLLTAMDQANLAGVVAARRTRVPLVVSYHTDVLAAAARSRSLFSHVRPRLARATVRRADAVVAVSDGVRDALVRLAPERAATITTIHNPTVGPQLYERATAAPAGVPGAPPLERTIVAAGRLVPAKGFDVLVDAFARIAPQQPDVHLLILGDGPLRDDVRRRAEMRGVAARVHLPGAIENPYPFMARCRVFASSSVWEGLPTVLVEAGALGCPIVATDCPSGPREIIGGRPQATLVAVGDVAALAAALDGALRAPYQRWLGDWRDHTRAHVASRYEDVLRAAASGGVR
jgi:glycosyltransferase involved in cell wall biosynthesis